MTKLGKCRRVFGESKDFTAVQQNTHADRDETRKKNEEPLLHLCLSKAFVLPRDPGEFPPARARYLKKKENEVPRGRGVV